MFCRSVVWGIFLVAVSSARAKSSHPLKCPDGDKPLLSYAAPSGKKLMVCGKGASANPFPSKFALSEFQVIQKGREEPLFAGDALHTYEVSYSKKEGIVVQELADIASDPHAVPFRRFAFQCDKKKCHPTESHCVLKGLKKNIYPKAAHELRVALNSKGAAPVETLLGQVFEQALTGDKKARRIFSDKKIEAKLDGATAEFYHQSRETLELASEAGCFKSKSKIKTH